MNTEDGQLDLLDLMNLADLWREEYRRIPDQEADHPELHRWPPFVEVCQRAFRLGQERGCPKHGDPDEWVTREDAEGEAWERVDRARDEGFSAGLAKAGRQKIRNLAGGRRLRGKVGRK